MDFSLDNKQTFFFKYFLLFFVSISNYGCFKFVVFVFLIFLGVEHGVVRGGCQKAWFPSWQWSRRARISSRCPAGVHPLGDGRWSRRSSFRTPRRYPVGGGQWGCICNRKLMANSFCCCCYTTTTIYTCRYIEKSTAARDTQQPTSKTVNKTLPM